jgi:3-hydroxybutyryl-CoA dehydratase
MKIHIGEIAEYSKLVSDAMVRAFNELTGDHNPVHLDEDYAQDRRFGRRIAHGMLTTSLISPLACALSAFFLWRGSRNARLSLK